MGRHVHDELGSGRLRELVATDLDVTGVVPRERHARRFMLVIRPAVIVVGVVMWGLTHLLDPASTDRASDMSMLVGAVVISIGALAARLFDPVRVTIAALVVDAALLLLAVGASGYPDSMSLLLVWPVIGIAYFWRPHGALLLAVGLAAGILTLSRTVDAWQDDRSVPIAAFAMVVAGALLAFMAGQVRRSETALARSHARDRAALALSRRIRLADEPHAAISEIARAVGFATDASCAIVALLEHDDDYVADIALWCAPAREEPPLVDVATLDPTLRHLAAAGRTALLTPAGLRIPPLPSEHDGRHGEGLLAATELGNTLAIEVAMRDLMTQLDERSGVLVPLVLGGRAVGVIVLAGGAGARWDDVALPVLEPLAPQLAAGLAQVVLVRDQRDALDALERVDRMRDRLIANVSHELRTPLTSTIGFIETLLRTDVELTEEMRADLMEHARDGSHRLLALVEDLLALGSTRPESLDLAHDPIDVGDLAADALHGIKPQPGRSVSLRVEAMSCVLVDRNRMLQVLGNLLVNALRHGEGDVEVVCALHHGAAVIDVLDHGPGVDPQHVHELFLPFARFSDRSDSTGLGLAICRTIVEAHGGAIEYGRTDDRTRFRVLLPAVTA